MRLVLLGLGIFFLFTFYLSWLGAILLIAYWASGKKDVKETIKEYSDTHEDKRKTYNTDTLIENR
tara:strand:+ start:5695 stop:5889 length:195 start_codon:yes stop_codon:yes gene_type:complete